MDADNLQWFLMGAALVGAVWAVSRLLRSSTANSDDLHLGRPEHADELSRHPLRELQERYTQVAQRKLSPPPEPEPHESEPPEVDIPYGIDIRPLPVSDDIDHLLPRQIGTFQRSEPRGDVYDLTYAEYTDGHNQICMSIAVCESPEAARNGIDIAQLESADVTEFVETISAGTEPSFLKSRINNPRMGAMGKMTVFMWSRGRYYFDANAPTTDLLDSFMNQFPF